MKIYLVESLEKIAYDTYDSMVVVAPDEETALSIHPRTINRPETIIKIGVDSDSWPRTTHKLRATLLGESISDKIEVVCVSFNAG